MLDLDNVGDVDLATLEEIKNRDDLKKTQKVVCSMRRREVCKRVNQLAQVVKLLINVEKLEAKCNEKRFNVAGIELETGMIF